MSQENSEPTIHHPQWDQTEFQGFIESFANLYDSMFYLNLNNHSLTFIKLSPRLEQHLSSLDKELSPIEKLKAFARQYADPKTYEQLIEILKLESAQKLVGSEKLHTFVLHLNEDGLPHHYRVQILGSQSCQANYVVTTRCIDEELQRQELLNRYDDVLSALAQEYTSIYYITTSDDKILSFSGTSRIKSFFSNNFNGMNYSKAYHLYVDNCIHPTERESMRRFLDQKNLIKKLRKTPTFTHIYLNESGRYGEMKCARVNENIDAFVLGFTIKDEEVRERLEQQRKFTDVLRLLYEETDASKAIDQLLQTAAHYYSADRAYLYEVDQGQACIHRSFEYRKPDVPEQTEATTTMPISEVEPWLVTFKKQGLITLNLLEAEDASYEPLHATLNRHSIQSFMGMPLISHGEVTGFVGIDNPRSTIDDEKMLKLLSVIIDLEFLRSKQDEEEQIILNKMTKTFTALSYANLKTDYLRTYATNDHYRPGYGVATSYIDTINKYIENCVAEEDRERVRQKTTPEYVIGQLKNNELYSVSFIDISYGHRHNQEIQFIRANNEGTCAVLCGIDNTDVVMHEVEIQNELRQAKDQAEAASRAKSTFLFNMSHDIRTPLNAIKGFTELAKRHQEDKERLNDYLDKIDVSNAHLIKLINDVLDMARIESGAVTITNLPVNLVKTSQMIVPMIQSMASEKGIEFRFDASRVQNTNVYSDHLHLNEILLNLLSNAIKYTRPGGHVEYSIVQTKPVHAGQASYLFTVKDDGVGMTPEFLQHIYDQFSREKSTTESGIIGTGLGMSIVRQLVDLMDGEISIESEVDSGTTIRLNFNFQVVDQQERDSLSESKIDLNARMVGVRILVTEDNPLNREIAVELLEDAGFEVDTAENGEEAVQKIKDGKPGQYDVILMDIQMPVMDGYQATQRIRSLKDCPLSTIPIIAMTANAFEEDRQRAIAAGMNDHLSKPINIDATIETIRRYLHKTSLPAH